jgi:hypothetical protein
MRQSGNMSCGLFGSFAFAAAMRPGALLLPQLMTELQRRSGRASRVGADSVVEDLGLLRLEFLLGQRSLVA